MVLSQEIIDQIISFHTSDTPLNQCEMARRLGITRRAVQYWIKKYQNNPSGSPLQGNAGRPQQLSNPEQTHREQIRLCLQSKREDPNFRAQEAEAQSERRERKRVYLLDSDIQSKRQKIVTDLNESCEEPQFRKISENFFEAVADVPCYCCDRLWFKSSIRPLSKSTLIQKGATIEFIKLVFYKNIGDIGQFCKTCFDAINNLKVPELAVSNRFEFPEIPDCLRFITSLEEQLISLLIICSINYMWG